MSRRILTPAAAQEIKRLYELRSPTGRPLHSQMEIAAMLGVSETTVFRVVHRRAAYTAAPDLRTAGEAQESEAKFKAEHPELFTAEGKMVAAVVAEKAKVQLQEETLAELTKPGGAYDFVRREGE